MKKLVAIVLLSQFGQLDIFAQKHDVIIASGYHAYAESWEANGFNFNFTNPRMVIDTFKRKIEFSLTNTSICDSLGELQLMYNGCYVADKFGNQMDNGNGINNGNTVFCNEVGARTNQGAIILPYPGKQSRYVLLTKMVVPNYLQWSTELSWSEIDMSKNGGKGKVILKNQKISTDSSHASQMTACKHANGRDWWLVLPPKDFHVRYTMMLLDPTGLHIHHTQEVGTSGTFQTGLGKSLMQTVFSPDGSKYVRSCTWDSTRVFDFDRCTGLLSDERLLAIPFNELTSGCGASVSPNSRYLYLTNVRELFQFDLWATDIQQSRVRLDSMDGFKVGVGSLQMSITLMMLGADGKIYISDGNSSFYWHTIHQPNEPGKACMARLHDLHLPITNVLQPCNCWFFADMWYDGTPNYPHYRLGPIDGSPCDTLGLDNHPLAGWHWDLIDTVGKVFKFADHSTYNPTNWYWDFGDGTTSQDTNPVHTFPANGIYHVCLTVCNTLSCDTICYDVVVDDIVATSIVVKKNKDKVLAYPNPVSQRLFIETEGEIVKATLVNILGQAVILDQSVNLDGLDTSRLADGAYQLILTYPDNSRATKSVIISH